MLDEQQPRADDRARSRGTPKDEKRGIMSLVEARGGSPWRSSPLGFGITIIVID